MNDLIKVAPSSQYKNDPEIDLREMITTFLNGKWLILFFTILFMLLAIVYASNTEVFYNGNLTLKVDPQKSGIPGTEVLAGLNSNKTSVSTEVEIIKSRKTLRPAVEKLKLDIWAQPKKILSLSNLYQRFFKPADMKKPNFFSDRLNTYFHQYAWGNETISVNRLSVPDYLINQTLELIARDDDEYDLFFQDQLLLKGKVNQLSTSNDGTIIIFVANMKALPGTIFNLAKLSQLNAIENLQGALQAYEIGENTGILKLTLEGQNKQLIVKTLDLISSTYLEKNKSRSSEDATNALNFLNEKIKLAKAKSDSAEEQLIKYKTNKQTADITTETKGVLAVIANIDSELQQVSIRRNELRQKYSANHPIIQSLNSQKAVLEKRKADNLIKVSQLPQTQQQLIKLEADFKSANAVYLGLLNNIQKYELAKTNKESNVYLIDSAVVDDQPVYTNKSRILVSGTLIGAILGTLLVFLRKTLTSLADDPEKIEKKFGLPIYATVPLSNKVNLTFGLNNKKRKPKKLLALEYGADPAIESLRSFRTSLHFTLQEAKNNIVMITGLTPNVGKSFISSNLSAVIAASKQRVLLIDADMRKGYLHSLFNKEPSPGLTDLINGEGTPEDIIQTINIGDKSMDVIFRGQIPPNPSELLMYSDFEKILDTLSKKYDVVIIDTPPIQAVTDPMIIGRYAGLVFMVLYSNQHSMKEIEHALNDLSNVGINTKGFIYNGCTTTSSHYKYGYEYGSGVKSDYGDLSYKYKE